MIPLRGGSSYLVSKPIDQHKRLNYRKFLSLCPYRFKTNGTVFFASKIQTVHPIYLKSYLSHISSLHGTPCPFQKHTLKKWKCERLRYSWLLDSSLVSFLFWLIVLLSFSYALYLCLYLLSLSYPRTCMYFFLMPHT